MAQQDDAVQRTYTNFELARLAGVDLKVVHNSRHAVRATHRGTQKAKLLAYMQTHGISWAQVVSAPFRSKRPKPPITETVEARDELSCSDPGADETPAPIAATPYPARSDREGLAVPALEPSPVPKSGVLPLSAYPLEALLAELTRRLPRAEVVLR